MESPTQFMQATMAQQKEEIAGLRAEIKRLGAILDPYHDERRYCPGCKGEVERLTKEIRALNDTIEFLRRSHAQLEAELCKAKGLMQ